MVTLATDTSSTSASERGITFDEATLHLDSNARHCLRLHNVLETLGNSGVFSCMLKAGEKIQAGQAISDKVQRGALVDLKSRLKALACKRQLYSRCRITVDSSNFVL
jgi:hypothetical protein